MRRSIRSISALTALLASLAAPVWAAQGVNLSWDACGAAGVDLKSFACDINTGLELLWPTFIPPAGITNLDAVECRLTIQSAAPVMPSWWKFGSSDCHAAGANLQTSSTIFPASCLSPWAVDAVGGTAYQTLATDRSELLVVAAVQDLDSAPLTAGVEYAAFAVAIRHSKSTGTGACAGCSEGVCILLTSMALDQSPGHTPSQVVLTTPVLRNRVLWQPQANPAPLCAAPTSSRPSTWGTIKSLYR